ncbi:MAG TPA: FAD-dependent monooxygenase [Lapillicoccus sp.]|jgi:2-polyprenyl-6-methoxyphenol hydroxylase-like FAD-dependent oxidoreductase|nr:FAD-dependent monooxygenase [Lapillicoccus sp.]
MPGTVDRAIVIGSSMAGLLAARVLSETYAEVILLDRDDLPYGPVARNGVPHMRHSHALLARGSEVVEELFPGLCEYLVSQGAATGDVQETVRMYAGPRPTAPGRNGLRAYAVSRPLLEWTIRERVAAIPGVTFYDRTAVLDLAFSADLSHVTGVVVTGLDGPNRSRTMEADLVVDASGRTSRTPEWLERRGYPPPPEERIRVDYTSVTRRFRRRSLDDTGGSAAITHGALPGTPRGGIILYQENDVWIVTLSGYAGVRPPTDLAEFRAYARTLCAPVIADVIDQLEPLDDGITYRFPADVRHRYEWVELFPDGLIVTGDALCAFDPSFGQGMSVAAAEAMELRHELRLGRQHLARRFFAAAARHVDTPWTVVVGAGAAAAGIELEEPARARLIKRYVAAVRQAAADDPVVAGAFLRVAHLVDRPERLLAPRVAARVAAASFARRRTATPGVGFGNGVLNPPLIWPATGPSPAPDHRGPVSSPRTGHLS